MENLILVNKTFIGVVTQLILKAKHNIYISTYKAELPLLDQNVHLIKFFRTLCEKQKNNIDIKILINWNYQKKSVPKSNIITAKELQKNGIQTRYIKNFKCCHAKIIIIDNKICVIGSHNLSLASCQRNFEVSLTTKDKNTVERLTAEFKEVWRQGKNF